MGRRSSGGASILILALLPQVAWSQAAPADKQEKVAAEGKIKSIGAGTFQMVTAKGDIWNVRPDPKAQNLSLKFAGTADITWLKPGQGVAFAVAFDKANKQVEAVGQLRVFVPTRQDKPGIESEANRGELKGLFTDKEPDPKANTPINYKVTGAVRGVRGTALTVAAGTTTIQVILAPDAKVSVETSDLRMMKEGDSVSIRGWAPQATMALASQISVTAAQPLTGAKKPAIDLAKPGEPKPSDPAKPTDPKPPTEPPAKPADPPKPADPTKPVDPPNPLEEPIKPTVKPPAK